MIPWRQQYADPERDAALGELSRIVFDASQDRAVQSFKDDSDINVIVRRFGVTNELPRSSVMPFYGDFSEAVDYQTALNRVRAAGEAFESLPAAVRRRFGNDPAELISFVQDASNLEEARSLGLVPKPRPVDPVPVSAPAPVGEEPAL